MPKDDSGVGLGMSSELPPHQLGGLEVP